MNIARSITRWSCAIVIGAALSIWIFVATLQATVLDRTVIKNWLAQSGVYSKGLNIQIEVASSAGGDTSLITPDMLQKAFAQTFDAAYVKENSNKVIDSAYDWLDGKAKAINFSIPVQDKGDAFAKNMATQLEPKLAALPVCSSRMGNTDADHLTCLPIGVTAADYANQLTKPSGGNAFLSAPLTQDTIKGQGDFPQLGWLPNAVQWARALVIWLPIATILLGAIYIAASGSDKIRGAGRVGRQLTIGAGTTLIVGLFLWYTGGSIDLGGAIEGGDAQAAAAVTTIVNPLAQTILPDIGRVMGLYGGATAIIGGLLWTGMFVWHHKRKPKEIKQHEVPPIVETKKSEPPLIEPPKKS